MAITLWGRSSSINVQKVLWALGELGLAYDHIPLGGKYKGNDTPEYLAMNPNGLVPTLRDGDLIVWESHAIVRYLAATYGAGSLWPEAPRVRGVSDQWTDWTATTFQPAWISVFWQVVRTPKAQQDPERIVAAVQQTNRLFGIMATRLAASPFLGGEQPSYADIVAGASLHRWTTMPVDRAAAPAIEAWHQRLDLRPAFTKAICVSYEELVGRLAF